MKHPFAASFAALFLVAAGVCVYAVYVHGPAVHFEKHSGETIVDLSFLGEYVIGTSRIRLVDLDGGATVWEIACDRETPIWKFPLHAGDNPVRVGLPDDLQITVVHPSAPTFHIRGGATYELSVWGNNGFAHWNVTRRRIRF